ncbi:SRPBCC family protein [Staphylococcus caprae]|uniref:SRPBCC family protein n=1 Tax=Staphylococcus caprae TaxID=29380 RepID=UPI0024802757|nr:SRPBCC family protein [Staphylococcus caprae]MDI0014326.1 SRPBCC family protein [Staphylococcus caprae]
MAKYNVENEHVEIDIERLLKFIPEVVYEAWTKEELLKQWFMTTQRTNQSFEADIQEGGQYRIVDRRNGKQNVIEGTYKELVLDEYVKMTIGMPGLSEEEDIIEVEFFERENGGTQMLFYYRSLVEKERRLTTLEYKQKKKEYHDSTAHGFELMIDQMQNVLEEREEQQSHT